MPTGPLQKDSAQVRSADLMVRVPGSRSQESHDDAPENQSDTVIPQAVTNSAPAGHLLMGEQDELFAVQLQTDVFAVLQMVAAGCGFGTSDRPDTDRTADAHQGPEPVTSR